MRLQLRERSSNVQSQCEVRVFEESCVHIVVASATEYENVFTMVVTRNFPIQARPV